MLWQLASFAAVIVAVALLRVVYTLLVLLINYSLTLQPVKDAPRLAETPEWDFIIVGGGSAGAVLASRLAADPAKFRVLLLEAGEEDAASMFKGAFFKVPLFALGFQATTHHWRYEAEGQDELMMKGDHWEEGDGCRGRPLIMTRGRVLGGSSSLNLCNYIRGHPAEYDRWADEHGLGDGWSYGSMLSHFDRAEDLAGATPDEDRARGVATSRRAAAPPASILAERLTSAHPISTSFVAACKRVLGGSGSTPAHALEAPAEGAALHWLTIRRGLRCSNARLLRERAASAARAEGRLRIETGCRVLKLLISSSPQPASASSHTAASTDAAAGASPRAEGVLARDRRGDVFEVRASTEVTPHDLPWCHSATHLT